MSKLTLLAVLAHPDDESFGMGGTLALYASRGVDVHLVCATRGEVGEVAPELLKGFESIAKLRESELRCAVGVLGLTGVHFLGYRDSGMPGSLDNTHPQALAAQPLDEVAAKVVRHIRELKPQIVLTFDPIGGYRHPDHIAIQRATVRAFKQAGNPDFAADSLPVYAPERLFFHKMPNGLLKFAVKFLPIIGKDPHKFGSNGDIDLVPIAEVDFPTNARIDIRSVLKKKEQAGACHASQGGGRMGGGIISLLMRLFSGTESFMRASPPVVEGEKVVNDLFT
ncbi:MAG: PIG-L family deacetylase [Candidatus Atribacteria bacterium]|nr:PIG-L family deacetylase [Candidatus Atribacteria bacterium]